MRTEQQMFELILETARCDERIRAVVMNGSRANPNAPRNLFQDFDIVYIVTDVEPFTRNLEWIQRFGESRFLSPNVLDLNIPEHIYHPLEGTHRMICQANHVRRRCCFGAM